MHDWTLVSLFANWKEATVAITLRNQKSAEVTITAHEFTDLVVPKKDDWGPSVSVNEVTGPLVLPNGMQYLEIEIQSGDKIRIEAKRIVMPIDAA